MQNFKFLKYTFTLVWLFIFWIFNYLFANNEYYHKNLIVNADIQQDGTIEVNEVFETTFNVYKHGFIRNIPLKYSIDGKKFRIFLENIKVDWTNFSTYETNGEKEIKIWDADRELIWNQRYSIHYSVYGLIRNFAGKGREELSWNVIPNGFDADVHQVRVELNLPKSYTWFTSEDFLVAADGKSNKLEDFEGTIDWSQGDKIILTYDNTIPVGNGITLAVKFPVGYFTFDHTLQEFLIEKDDGKILSNFWIYKRLPRFLQQKENELNADWWVVVNGQTTNNFYNVMIMLLWMGIVVLFWIYKRWKEKEQKGEKIIMPQVLNPITVQYYPPEGVNSAEAWILYHKKFTARCMFSLFYQWCAKGLISMDYRNNKIIITKMREIDNVPQYERKFFNKIFSSDKIMLDKDSHLYMDINEQWLIDYGEEKQRFYGVKSIKRGDLFFVIGVVIVTRFILAPFLESVQIDPFHVNFVLSFMLIHYYFRRKWLTILACCIFLNYNLIFWWLNSEGFLMLLMIFFSLLLNFILIVSLSKKIDKKQDTALKFSETWISLHEYLCWYQQFLVYCEEGRLKMFLKEDPLFFDKTIAYAVVLWVNIKTLINKFKPIYEKISSNFEDFPDMLNIFSSMETNRERTRMVNNYRWYKNSYNHSDHTDHSSSSSYDSSSWFSSWSSRDSGSSSGSSWGGWWWGGGRSW